MNQRTSKSPCTDHRRGEPAGDAASMGVMGMVGLDDCCAYGFEGIEEAAALLHDGHGEHDHDAEQEQRLGLACRSRIKPEAIVGYVAGNSQPRVNP